MIVVPNIGVLTLFAVLGAVICAKARVSGGAVVFGLIGLVLFVSTPAGSGLPGCRTTSSTSFDGLVQRDAATSRAAVVARALDRERRREMAARDAEILARSGDDPADLDGLAAYAARTPLADLD